MNCTVDYHFPLWTESVGVWVYGSGYGGEGIPRFITLFGPFVRAAMYLIGKPDPNTNFDGAA